MDPLQKLNRMILHRADIAMRWFGLTDRPAVVEFVHSDPDIEAYFAKNPEITKMIFRNAMLEIIEDLVDGKNIDEHRRLLGDELVDRIIESSKRLKDEDDRL
jgi:hypothetical protein